ncbi:glycosyltransferase family 2 protein [Microbulbifer agarilyticus]|uniref:glycosyltransferase family 2 protein n=1 Tax=Microbulbifer agarilyticus TaxID=260552 RepID=UPI001CD74439|nr:glycosyltransferase family 2 protein [Microbulbifer agarilyticus]MCA0901398.1 glycosyltransferase family 2 protein [Microbulbifer agarilyticus]
MPQIPATGTLIGIVTYNPDLSVFEALLERVSGQDCDVVVYDNASDNLDSIIGMSERNLSCSVVAGQANIGISGAANAIFGIAVQRNKEFVLLFDQDSIPSKSYAKTLISAYRELCGQGVNVAALGGIHTCRFTNQSQPLIQFGKWKPTKLLPEECEGSVPVDFLITSGTLIPVQSLKKIGGYDDQLFIDSVDLEWCSRALALGFQLFGVVDAKFTHEIGEGRSTIMGLPLVKTHSPIRTFYINRNILILSKREYVSMSWKINVILRASLKILFFVFFDKARYEHLKAIVAAARYQKNRKTLAEVNSEAVAGLSL